MDTNERRTLINQVEQQISALLDGLEAGTGEYVWDIAIYKVYAPGDEYVVRRVAIDLRQLTALDQVAG